MSSNSRIAWGIIGTGNIARTFAQNLPGSQTGKLVAVASRNQASADTFIKDQPGVRAYGDYQALLNGKEVQAVYISTPHPMHLEWVVKAARAGKHILCEKPLGMNHAEVMVAAEAARQNGVFLMEAFMYRCHPQTAKVVEIVKSGRLGQIRLINAEFAFDAGPSNPESRLFKNSLGGGGILDVGCYCMSMTRLIAGAAQGKAFAEPHVLKAIGRRGETGTDEQALALLDFGGGIQAQLVTGVRLNAENAVRINGSEGSLRIPSPWFCGHPTSKLELTTHGKTEEIEITSDVPLYSLEIDVVGRHLADGEAPQMPIDDTVGNMAALDRWRVEIGLVYESEKLGVPRQKYAPLRKSNKEIPNLRAPIPGLDPKKPASRFALGTMLEGSTLPVPHAFALYDYFFEHGGNLFDTAHIYSGGEGERTLGDWIRQRGVRDQVTIIAKGAHTPNCTPEGMARELKESFDRLQIDRADIYMLHRDNLQVPAAEFVDALNQQVKAGRVGIFGGSNWTLERVKEANDYAKSKGVQGFGALSNQFSLARMIQPVWGGCVCGSDPAFRAWHEKTGVPLFAWSSQARGFFINGARDNFSDPELARIWYSDDNFDRLVRVQELAREKKTEPIHLAAAYVLQQKFPVFALIGPRKLSELSSSFKAFEVELTAPELAWLNLESPSRRG